MAGGCAAQAMLAHRRRRRRNLWNIFVWVNWIYAIATFTLWKNTITKTRLGDMPLQFLHTSVYAIVVIIKAYTPIIFRYIHVYSRMDM
jgi:hypothetical protein